MSWSLIEEYLSENELEIFRKIADISLVDLDKKIEWQGRIMSPGFSANAAKYFYENWSPNKGDVLVSGYPKTGKLFNRNKVILYSFPPFIFIVGTKTRAQK